MEAPPPQTFDLNLLTRQEEKILLLAADDLLNKEIADRLHISEATVKRHRANCYEKLNVSSSQGVRALLRYVRTLR